MPVIVDSADMLVQSKAAFESKEMKDYFQFCSNAYLSAMRELNIQEPNQLGDDALKHGLFWQTFWEKLPDTPRIRVLGFFTVCDLAEWYCFGDR
jgi:hypothetical protein